MCTIAVMPFILLWKGSDLIECVYMRRNVSQHTHIVLGTLVAPALVSACVAFVFLSPVLTGNQTLNYRYDEKGSRAST